MSNTLPTNYQEYINQVDKNLSIIEKMTKNASSLDERIDITNMLLLQMTKSMSLLLENRGPDSTLKSIKISAARLLVPMAGDAENLPNIKLYPRQTVVIKARIDNLDEVYVGNTKLEAEDHSKSFPLYPGESLEYEVGDNEIFNLNEIWIDAVTNDDGIFWTTVEEKKNG